MHDAEETECPEKPAFRDRPPQRIRHTRTEAGDKALGRAAFPSPNEERHYDDRTSALRPDRTGFADDWQKPPRL
ncbi:hypothetical protein VTI28DRAFT_6912 [Corynascus sepedonium]